ncbi:transcriptional corepressor LEUNIG_HOMOLOG isoform X4 [Jatropha curcas]|uniref:transcriptional corepressor LEUNIG_HOMOLOG isoform X4 n=1 Tax=Jatropha curcas TaxID=180498 RepID=UPI001894F428|nr:transcriptional corepressor LEUNIG_HOMOLOG isoform X4 [Jatropha curcas]
MIMASDEYDLWDAEKMLDLYVHDYLVKRKLHNTAAIFQKEANVGANPVAIDGFLHEWWTLFYDLYASKQLEYQEAKAKANSYSSAKERQVMQNELQNVLPIVPQLSINQQRPGQFPVGPSSKMRQLPACSLLARMYGEEQHLPYPVRTFNQNLQLLRGNKFDLSKSAATRPSYPQQQIQNHAQQLVQNRIGNSCGGASPMDTTFFRLRGTFPITNSCDIGMNEEANSSGFLLNPLMQTPNHPQQFLMLTEQHQRDILVQSLALTSGNLTSSLPGNSAKIDGRNLKLPRINLNGKDAQKRDQIRQTKEQQNQHDQCLKMQSAEGRKRRRLSYSRTGDKSLVSANAEVDKAVDENVESFLSAEDEKDDNKDTPLGTLKLRSTAHRKNDHKGFTFEEIGCLSSSKSKVVCCHFSSDGRLLASAGHDKKVFVWNMETFDFIDSSEGHSLLITDVRFRPSSTILATSSFDRTVQIWDAAKPSKSLFKLLGHADQVMALDFHPRKVDLLCSCDSNDEIRLWNVNRGACLHVFKGATKQVRFQPQCGKLLAAASGNSINVINVENNHSVQFSLKGHAKEVLSLCWDMSGEYIASVSEDSARIWSLVTGGSCMHKLFSNGNKFQSCTFHPGYSQLLMIGGYQSLQFWNTIESNKTWSIPAHKGLIAALTDSLETDMIASASHDKCVKLWK